jgi:hypothetical protein
LRCLPDVVKSSGNGEPQDELARQFYEMTYTIGFKPPQGRVSEKVWKFCRRLVKDGRPLDGYRFRTDWGRKAIAMQSKYAPGSPESMSDPDNWDKWGSCATKDQNGEHQQPAPKRKPLLQ